ncbi:MAG: hypothetical protein GOMPHAMPRED_004245 [Gomphillus americanus]|uniref:Phosphoribulokinase/uridine kinase domain-containing protein n=1 Tax=Gomphillus americanus TaxID=1940652 RepID=A0A8H3FLP4_9LECA|nr:MAG: hypothetical protein GOMPHAMPRED_004245 [Gomphillus americanus]
MNEVYHNLAQRAVQALVRLEAGTNAATPRLLIALAGAPGAGKTTTALAVADMVNATLLPAADPRSMVVVSMDGFHYPRSRLDTMPDPKLAHEKRGAPFTFDAQACVNFVKACRDNTVEHQAPSFDHARKDPVAGGTVIPTLARIVLIEGNYLLSDEQPWKQISDFVDEKWFIDVQPVLARTRVAERHVLSGITKDLEAGYWRADNIDLPNGVYIKEHLVKPDITVESIEEIAR